MTSAFLHPLLFLLGLQGAGMALFGLSRGAVFLGHRERFAGARSTDVRRAFAIGMRMDLVATAYLLAPAIPIVVFAPAAGGPLTAWTLAFSLWLGAAVALMLAGTFGEYFYFEEYGAKFNHIFLEYARPSPEVLGMLWKEYPLVKAAAGIGLATAAAVYFIHPVLLLAQTEAAGLGSRAGQFAIMSAWVAICARGIGRRPLGSGAWEFSNSQSLNQLAANGFYQVLRIAYDERKHGGNPARLFGKPIGVDPEAVVRARVEGPRVEFPAGALNALDRVVRSGEPARRPNIVMVLMESHAASFIGALGSARGVTPHFDRLSREGLLATRMYASGDRTARGIESVLSSFPPLPGMSTLKRAGAHGTMFTAASYFKSLGYRTRFYYGGDPAYDNMRGFMLSNGFDSVFARDDVSNPVWETSWGISDENLYGQLLEELVAGPPDEPTFQFMLTISNHRPYTWPPGKIDPIRPGDKIATTFQYADFAMGQFIENARGTEAWKNTVFVFVADHGIAVHGRNLVPVERFHIPMLILAPGIPGFEPERIEFPCSQLDTLPTLLGLLGGDPRHCCFGRDLRRLDPAKGSALMHYYGAYAFVRGNRALMMSAGNKGKLFEFLTDSASGSIGAEVREDATPWENEALSLMIAGERLYKQGKFRVGG